MSLQLVDYGGGNIGSITRCLERLKAQYRLVGSGNDLTGGSPVVFPGVGSFGACLERLARSGLDTALREAVKSGTPLLAICVGLQVLMERSAESPGVPGLGLIPGEVVRFTQGKVPQIGWNRIEPRAGSEFEPGHVYFVNSYYAVPADESVVLYWSDYHVRFCAAIQTENITAYQFHPEKSGEFGHKLLRRWLDAL